jgi:DNA-binding MarR family transcriptional regulator/GNAT superfamily N-acetyltransferase
MGESRLIWEIGSGGVELRVLRARLGLDSGYLSRVLRSLEYQGLVKVDSSLEDRRVRRACLTATGLEERAELDRRSDALAANILEALTEYQRRSLTAAMKEVEQILRASLIRFEIEDPTSSEAKWCFGQYFAELDVRFESGFDATRSISADAHELVLPNGVLMIARLRNEPVGCGALKFPPNQPGEVKRMWIAPMVRGLGAGRQLMNKLERQAINAGVRCLHLETHKALKEAIALYRSSGYAEVNAFNAEPYAHHWFEKRLDESP